MCVCVGTLCLSLSYAGILLVWLVLGSKTVWDFDGCFSCKLASEGRGIGPKGMKPRFKDLNQNADRNAARFVLLCFFLCFVSVHEKWLYGAVVLSDHDFREL